MIATLRERMQSDAKISSRAAPLQIYSMLVANLTLAPRSLFVFWGSSEQNSVDALMKYLDSVAAFGSLLRSNNSVVLRWQDK